MSERPRYLSVPYGDGELEFMVQPWFDVDVVESASATPVADLTVATGRALASPLGSAGLADLAAEAIRRGPAARAIIGVTDLTRASPDAVLVPPLLDELNRGGIPDERITVIVAIGLHRATTEAEKREKLGGAVDRVRVVDSDGRDPAKWADLGAIEPYGVPGFTQKLIKEAELVVATGIVEPHQYAGYSGGPKTVAIGCAGEPTITATHGMRFLEDPGVRLAKVEGNPFHDTVRELARRAGLAFCINVVTDDRERVVAIAAGDPDAVFAELAAKAAALYTRPIAKQYDIVIAGVGHPKDVNLYQASRAATYLRFAPTPVVREGGAIIIAARLEEGAGEGTGEQRFLAALERAASPAAVVEEAREHFAGGEQRAVMVALTLQHCAVIVAASEAPEVVRLAKLRAAVDVEEALDLAYEHIGRPARASVLLVPRALHTLPIVQTGVPT
ncbi:MAG: nickel-dependent lactate racemase [Chloroflexi bacterium]|nr:MAG: nickel-dependent lactate racemase [Chloroflexota bacterium]TMG69596.1 MAG: nickel-dependent lactate racemase [Chloroflexota bacterium]